MSSGSRVFFVHLMKTGGAGVSHLLRDVLGEEVCYPLLRGVVQERRPDVLPGRATPVEVPDGGIAVVRKLQPDVLLGQPEGVLDRMRLISVHMPAWVCEVVPGEFVRTTILREPVARTVSHLRHISRTVGDGAPIDELWATPMWRDRLANYQVRMLGADRPAPEADALSKGWASRIDDESDSVQDAFRAAVKPFFGTGVREVETVDDSFLARARSRLASFDVVGTTEDLATYVDRLRSATGLPIPDAQLYNVATDGHQAGGALLESIREATLHDQILYAEVAGRDT